MQRATRGFGKAGWARIIVLGGLLLATASAQTPVFVPDASTTTGPLNHAPLGARGPAGGWQNLRTQILVPGRFLPAAGSTIRDLGFVGGSNGDYTYTLIEVRLGHATSSFTTQFASNVTASQTVLRRDNARVTMRQDSFTELGLQASFRHDGHSDLVVDIVIQGAFFSGSTPGTRRSDSLATVYALDYDVHNPVPSGYGPVLAGARLALHLSGNEEPVVVGTGCPKADNRPPQIASSGVLRRGTTVATRLVDGTANSGAALVIGSSDTLFLGLALPFDLAPLGAPQCLWRTDALATLTVATDAAGNTSVPLPIPDLQSLVGRRVLQQWLALAPQANNLELVVSGLLVAQIHR